MQNLGLGEGTVPIFVSAKMGLSPLPGFWARSFHEEHEGREEAAVAERRYDGMVPGAKTGREADAGPGAWDAKERWNRPRTGRLRS